MSKEEPRRFWEMNTLRTIAKYWEDGRYELWLSDKDNSELYLIKHDKFPSSPIVNLKIPQKDELSTKSNNGAKNESN